MYRNLDAYLRDTLYIHQPLPLPEEGRLEEALAQKIPLERRAIAPAHALEGWRELGAGKLTISPAGNITLTSPTVLPQFPPEARDTHHTHYGVSGICYDLPGEDLRAYNRLCVTLRAQCDGHRAPHLHIQFYNEGEIPLPDKFDREGTHQVNLKNGEWTRILWEIPDLPRDKVTGIAFFNLIAGRDTTSGEYTRYEIADVSIQRVERCEHTRGWQPNPGQLCASFSGYAPEDEKIAIGTGLQGQFQLRRKNETVYSAPIRIEHTPIGTFSVLDFTPLRAEGDYELIAEGAQPLRVRVRANPWRDSAWKALNFLFCERCGYPVPGRHGMCHTDIVASFEGKHKLYLGGWHDAADLSQQTLQSAEIAQALLLLSANAAESALQKRLGEEALWGLEFTLRSRLGKGFRMSSAGITRWTDGLVGNMDDGLARVHDQPFDNYLCAAVEACAYETLGDEGLRQACLRAAREDYAFAKARYEAGLEPPPPWEHSFMTSPALFHAAAGYSAAKLYSATGREAYLQDAAAHAEYVLRCQQTAWPAWDIPIRGFFYRDDTHRVIQHFNHQSREHLFMQCLTDLYALAPEHPRADAWYEAIRLYGEYVRAIAGHTMPFGMLPSGIYGIHEAEDEESFRRQHLMAGEEERAHFTAQCRAGKRLSETHYLRAFPVWFSFRGNAAVMLSAGVGTALAGRTLEDPALKTIATRQLQFMVGRNPFAQSLVYGEGDRYAAQYAVHPGEMVGEMPVGMQSFGDTDEPYWPQAANATYKEVWTSTVGRYLLLLSALEVDL